MNVGKIAAASASPGEYVPSWNISPEVSAVIVAEKSNGVPNVTGAATLNPTGGGPNGRFSTMVVEPIWTAIGMEVMGVPVPI